MQREMSSAKSVGCGDEPVDKPLMRTKNNNESRIET